MRYPVSKVDRQSYINTLAHQYHTYSKAQIEAWFMRYGTRCEALLEWLVDYHDSELSSLSYYTKGELKYILKHEYVETTLDILLRRTSIAIEGKLNNSVFEEISTLVAQHFNWSDSEQVTDRTNTKQVLSRFHGVELDIAPVANQLKRTATITDKNQSLNGEEYVFNQ